MVLKTLSIPSQPVEPTELKGDPHHLAPLLRDVIRFAKPERILDATAGSGVTATVADESLIPCITSDLNAPQGGTDLFERDDPDTYDIAIFHPEIWCARPDAEHPHDLGATMSWDAYVELNRDAILHLAGQLRDDGHIVIIAPTTRRKGTTHSLARDLVNLIGAPREPEMVHPHPNCRSRGTMYGKKFIPIAHDPVLFYSKKELLAALDDE